MKFNWQHTFIICVTTLGLAGFIVRSLLTGDDIPINFQILFGAVYGLTFGSAGITTLFRRDEKKGNQEDEKKGKEDKDA